jgi:protein phosphatase
MAAIRLPRDAVVVLIGISGSGKSTFAARHFAAGAVLASDAFRALVADDAGDQSATDDAFTLLHAALGMRLRRGRLTVVDATNVQGWARRPILDLAARHHRPAVAIVLDLPLATCLARNAARTDRRLPADAVRRQRRHLLGDLGRLEGEGFAAVHRLGGEREVDEAKVSPLPMSAAARPRRRSAR